MFGYDNGYDEGYQAGKNAARSDEQMKAIVAGGFSLAGSVMVMIWMILTTCIIYSGALMVAHLLLKSIGLYDQSGTWEYLLWLFGVGYLITCILFYIKGIMIIGKIEGKWWWMLIFLLCFFVICVMPVLVFQSMLEDWLGPSGRTGKGGTKYYMPLSWSGAILIGAFIYQRYKLTKDHVLIIARWAYLLGIKTARRLLRGSADSEIYYDFPD